MGEIAEMMLDGTLCEGCGEFLDGDGDGIPRYCSPECARDSGATLADPFKRARKPHVKKRPTGAKTHKCPSCGKLCRGEGGLTAHVAAKHAGTADV